MCGGIHTPCGEPRGPLRGQILHGSLRSPWSADALAQNVDAWARSYWFVARSVHPYQTAHDRIRRLWVAMIGAILLAKKEI